MPLTTTLRNTIIATSAALAIFALSSTEVAGQQPPAAPQGTMPSPFPDAAAKEAYNAKMRRVLSVTRALPAGELPEMCHARIMGFADAVVKYNRDPVIQWLLVKLSEDTLNNYARFVNCTDKTDAKIRVVNSPDEDRFRLLMAANGIIPNTPTIYGPAYQASPPAAPAVKTAPAAPTK